MSHPNEKPNAAALSYRAHLKDAQIQLTKLQKSVVHNNQKVAVVFEGRDAAGKNGVIKRITEHLSPREIRVVALDRPSDRGRSLVVLSKVCRSPPGRWRSRAVQQKLVQPRRCGTRYEFLHRGGN